MAISRAPMNLFPPNLGCGGFFKSCSTDIWDSKCWNAKKVFCNVFTSIVYRYSSRWCWPYRCSSICCCKETPPMTGWNLDIFLLALWEIREVVSQENSVINTHIYSKCMLYKTSIASAQAYAVRTGLFQVRILCCMTEFSGKQLCRFPGWIEYGW